MGTYQVLLIPDDNGAPPRRVDVEQDTQRALPQLQELVGGDHIAGPLLVCGFDPDRGRDLDCPRGFEDRLAIRRPLPAPTDKEHGERSVTYTWELQQDEHGGRELATLSVHHDRAGVNMLTGRQHGAEFTAIVGNRSEQPASHGGTLVRVRLGSGLAICREPAARFSAKRLAQFADTALAALGELYGDSDPRVTRYFRTATGGAL